MGPHTNTAHFSIMMGPAHHLDGHYTIFGAGCPRLLLGLSTAAAAPACPCCAYLPLLRLLRLPAAGQCAGASAGKQAPRVLLTRPPRPARRPSGVWL